MAFNLKKNAQNKNKIILPTETKLQNNNDKLNLSLKQDKTVSHYDALLDKDRRPYNGTVVTHEAMLDEVRKKADSPEKTTEGRLEDVDSPLFPHRQFANGEDKYQVAPVNAMTHAFDRKYRDAFSKVNKGADTAFWDKYVGDQLDGKMTKVPSNLPQSGSQLHDNPERFGKLKNIPLDPSAIVNRKNFDVGLEISPMHGFASGEKGITIAEDIRVSLASIKNADSLLFGIYLKAAKENREITDIEKEIIDGINKDKSSLMISLAQNSPLIPPPNPINQNPSEFDETGADFEDNNPNSDINGNEVEWGSQSGFDRDSYENGLPPETEFPQNLENSNSIGDSSFDPNMGIEPDVADGHGNDPIDSPFGLDDRIPTPEDADRDMGIGKYSQPEPENVDQFGGSDSSVNPTETVNPTESKPSYFDLGTSPSVDQPFRSNLEKKKLNIDKTIPQEGIDETPF